MDKLYSQFLRRLLFLGALQIVLLLVLISRMAYLQVVQEEHYKVLSEGNRTAVEPSLPPRGRITDRNGVELATNRTSFRATFHKDGKTKLKDILPELEHVITFSEEEKTELLEKDQRTRGIQPLLIKDSLSWEEVSALELHSQKLPRITVELALQRFYPEKEISAHVLGYVAAPSQREVGADESLAIPGLMYGKVGIEKMWDDHLRGEMGYKYLEVNARRQVVRELEHSPGIPGENMSLALDQRLQNFAQKRLQEFESASLVVVNIETGEILALVSNPSYDPNLFPDGISHLNWRNLMDNPYVPLTNKAVSGTYPPGSPMKTLVILAGLESGVITKDTTFFCPGYHYVGNHKFHCWKKGGHGTINAVGSIRESCDVFLYETAKRLGIDRISQIYKQFGFGEKVLGNFPHEKPGLIPDKDWKKESKGENWTVSDTIMTSIGQGFVLTTPIQLAQMMARLASHGKEIDLSLVKGNPQNGFQEMGLNPKNVDIILEAMTEVTNDPRGTAYAYRILEASYAMGGKTGTSQVRRITDQQRLSGQTKTHHLPWKYREHGTFVGFAPSDHPKYAVAVVIEHSAGAAPAAQVARDILQFAQKEKI
ncbi:Cell division protein FtsI/penicillin-binding protein 2 [Candidatus Bealeia paramacronuclearis]|uniref:Cell division protein FtsI/penicillin-binding protein 2 n=1 Tax=Candidatus Bealeia paramacronuclearis TaxID=1921001 RepID=A0ABZ2C0J3_9PROT|nr:Cell division protein FtsI/penicillin-binding protein 2 [Candidatus Bealeia paramacronuclearis]